MISSIKVDKSAMEIHLATFKYAKLLAVIFLFLLSANLYSHPLPRSLQNQMKNQILPTKISPPIIPTLNYPEVSVWMFGMASLKVLLQIGVGLAFGMAVGFAISVWSRKVIRDNQVLILLPLAGLVFISLVSHKLHPSFSRNLAYPAYTSFSLTFRNAGFSRHLSKTEKLNNSNTVKDLSLLAENFSENCLFFITGILTWFGPRLELLTYLRCVGYAMALQMLRYAFIILAKLTIFKRFRTREKLRNKEIVSFVFSEKYSNFSVVLLYEVWEIVTSASIHRQSADKAPIEITHILNFPHKSFQIT